MKSFLNLIIVTFLLIGCSGISDFRVSSDHPDISHENGITLYEGLPFDGHIVGYYHDGTIKSLAPFKDGLAESVKTGFYPGGELMYERPYEDGEKHGIHKGYHRDGTPRFVYHFEKGLSIGTHQEWYPSGQLAKLMNFKKGKPFGEQKVWRSDGKIRANYVIREDGRRYGLVGMKRCKNLDVVAETIKPLTAAIYEGD